MSKKKRPSESTEVPITPMLDMAFQLLTFFILTYHPMPSEVQFVMNLLPAAPKVSPLDSAPPPNATENPNLPAAMKTMETSLRAGEGGSLGRVRVGENEVQGLAGLKRELTSIINDPSLPFDQALIQVDPNLKYAELVRVIDVFSELKVTKISFGELTTADEGG